jgi:hypothetical protein
METPFQHLRHPCYQDVMVLVLSCVSVRPGMDIHGVCADDMHGYALHAHPKRIQDSDAFPSLEMEVLKDRSAWHLVDGPVDVSGLFRINARVLQVTSPDRTKFKEFLNVLGHTTSSKIAGVKCIPMSLQAISQSLNASLAPFLAFCEKVLLVITCHKRS